MVIIGDFSFHLVDAQSLQPLDEYAFENVDKVYVEAEEGMEYYISLQKIRASECPQSLEFYVDSEKLAHRKIFKGEKISSKVDYTGLWRREKGRSTTTALRFSFPEIADAADSNLTDETALGSVQICVYEAYATGAIVFRQDRAAQRFRERSLSKKLHPVAATAAADDSCLCSGEGTLEITKIRRVSSGDAYETGPPLHTVTFRYCTRDMLRRMRVIPY